MSLYALRASAVTLLLTFTTAAMGHSASDATTPADGATLEEPPDEIRIRFDQPIRITLVRITDDGGDEYDVTYDRGEETKTLVSTPESLPSGAYTVEWRGLSVDGHPASGDFAFRLE